MRIFTKKFVNFLQNQISNLKDALRSVNLEEKKINRLIKDKFLSPLEQRILFYENFETTVIEIDEITMLRKCLSIHYGRKSYTS